MEPNEPKVSRDGEAESGTHRRGVYVTDDTWLAAKSYAAGQAMSVSSLFERAVLQYLAHVATEKQGPSARSLVEALRKDTQAGNVAAA